jgi:hypothetical protein
MFLVLLAVPSPSNVQIAPAQLEEIFFVSFSFLCNNDLESVDRTMAMDCAFSEE